MQRFLGSMLLLFFLAHCRFVEDRPTLGPRPEAKDMLHFTRPLEQPISVKKAKKAQEKFHPVFEKKVSLCINDAVSIKRALLMLCRRIGVDLQIGVNIQGKWFFQATDRPFIAIIDDLCTLTHLRYKIHGKTLILEEDTPYVKNYHLQFLNLSRHTQNRISVATDVFSNPENQKPTSGDNGSNSEVKHESKNDFWLEIENNLKIILEEEGRFTVHKQGGMICVRTNQRMHRQIQDYFNQLRNVSASQVLIEAKIVEVALSEQYRSGINWQKITGGDLRFSANFGNLAGTQAGLNTMQGASDFVSFGLSGRDFEGILQALSTFGSSRTISSPRLTVMNNQSALLKVAQNQVYFRLNYDRSFYNNNNRESINVSSDIQTVPIGLVMAVQPSIDQESGEIILSLRPTISRLAQSVRDPAVDVAISTAQNNANIVPSMVPVVEVREIDSILRLKDGEIAVMGGLMEVRSRYRTSKIPGAGDIPFAGELFKSTNEGDEVVELVILLKAHIMPISQAPKPDVADARLLNYVPRHGR
jgi:general secretion pathway protein D